MNEMIFAFLGLAYLAFSGAESMPGAPLDGKGREVVIGKNIWPNS